MKIKVTNLPSGIHDFRFKKSVTELKLGQPFIDNFILDVVLDKSLKQIVLNCNLTFFLELSCDRCLSEYKKEITTNFILLYVFDKKDFDQDEMNIKFLSPTQDKINLVEDVIEYAELSIPLKQLCKEDCRGLCHKCGTNLNENKCDCTNEEINPVWESLLKIKSKLN
ncbi:MAG: hypothetical protein CR986_02050 [Ignavibacteriae bacterium]|nr:MAG: hypothetical protein CR986_02050 [Ignavibacteriota bacterium]